jgi:hypothetical protein
VQAGLQQALQQALQQQHQVAHAHANEAVALHQQQQQQQQAPPVLLQLVPVNMLQQLPGQPQQLVWLQAPVAQAAAAAAVQAVPVVAAEPPQQQQQHQQQHLLWEPAQQQQQQQQQWAQQFAVVVPVAAAPHVPQGVVGAAAPAGLAGIAQLPAQVPAVATSAAAAVPAQPCLPGWLSSLCPSLVELLVGVVDASAFAAIDQHTSLKRLVLGAGVYGATAGSTAVAAAAGGGGEGGGRRRAPSPAGAGLTSAQLFLQQQQQQQQAAHQFGMAPPGLLPVAGAGLPMPAAAAAAGGPGPAGSTIVPPGQQLTADAWSVLSSLPRLEYVKISNTSEAELAGAVLKQPSSLYCLYCRALCTMLYRAQLFQTFVHFLCLFLLHLICGIFCVTFLACPWGTPGCRRCHTSLWRRHPNDAHDTLVKAVPAARTLC